MKNFRYFLPRTIDEALGFLEKHHKDTSLMAGGTDLLIRMKDGKKAPNCIIDLTGIPELDLIEYDEKDGLRIGALSSISSLFKIERSFFSNQYFGLVEAASSIGSIQIRNKGTVGGNLCNAAPSADLAPPLIVMNAVAKILGRSGERTVCLEEFFLNPGKTVLKDNEILLGVQVPKLSPRSGTAYLKYSRRGGMDLAIVGVACLLIMSGNSRCKFARIAMGAVAPIPVRAKRAEVFLTEKEINDKLIEEVSELAAEDAKPISDLRATANYRIEIIKVLVKRAVSISIKRALDANWRINET